MAYTEVEDGVRLFHLVLGQGRPIVLLHGWTMSHLVWDRLVPELAGSHSVVLPDLRGHGDSDKPLGPYDVDRQARDVAALLDRLGLGDVTLVGWSFGGTTAIRTASRYGERLAQLVLVNAAGPKYLAGDGFPHGHSEETLADWLRQEREETAAFRRFCMASMPRRAYDGLFTDWLWQQSMRTPSWAAAPMLEAYARADLRDELSEIRVPTLVLHGVHDEFCAIEAARCLAARVERAELVEFSESGHSPQWEENRGFMRELNTFLAGRL
ncbi:MAG: alpha/beta fold hydrolase [Thermoleophilaceae bacterium]